MILASGEPVQPFVSLVQPAARPLLGPDHKDSSFPQQQHTTSIPLF
jgi:hypothetical protein